LPAKFFSATRERRRLPSSGAAACALAVLTLTVGAGDACSSRRSTEAEANSTSPAKGTAAASPSATPEASPAPIAWADVARSYERVSDYVCLYEKEERAISNGEMQTIRLSFRKPFDVRMEWLDDKGAVDQTGVYRQGANGGKVLARRKGLFGSLMGTMRLDPNDSLALEDSRHPVTEVGLGKIIERAQAAATNPRVNSRFDGEETLDHHPAYRFEFTSSGDALMSLNGARKAIVWIDRDLKLPVKVELYDASNTLLERHRFKDVRINTKLSDKTFTL
jgi:outer membrane lipoprotein-sorting protein